MTLQLEIVKQVYNVKSVSQMSDLEEKLIAFAASENLQIVYSAQATEVNGKTGNMVFVLTETEILVLSVKTTKLAILYSYYIFDIVAIQLSELEEDLIKFHVKSKYLTIASPNRERIAEEATKLMSRALTKSEFETVTLPKFQYKLPRPTVFNVLNRIRHYVFKQDVKLPKKEMEEIEKALLQCKKSILLSYFKGFENTIPCLLSCFEMRQEIEELQFSGFEGVDLWSILNNNVEQLTGIVSIVCETAEMSLIDFLEKRVNDIALSFTGNVPIRVLRKALRSDKVKNLSLKQPSLETWARLMNCHEFGNLRFFSTVNVPRVDISVAVDRVRHIYALSLPNSNLLIGNVLELLSISEWDNLHGIDLSGNIGRGFVDSTLALPKHLFKIHVNSVEWEEKALVGFLNLVGRHKKGLKLSMSDTSVDSSMDCVLSKVDVKFGCSLYRLSWDGNVFSAAVASFLSRFPSLTELSLNMCINDGNIAHLLQFLANNANVTTVSLRGAYFYDPCELVRHVSAMKNVKSIDISEIMIDDEVLPKLGVALVKHKGIETVIVDQTDVFSVNAWKKFLATVETKKKLKVSFPVNDLARLGITWDSPDFACVSNSFKSICELEARDVCVVTIHDPFPSYLTESQLSRLKHEVHRMRKGIVSEVPKETPRPREFSKRKKKRSKSASRTRTVSLDRRRSPIDEVSHHRTQESHASRNVRSTLPMIKQTPNFRTSSPIPKPEPWLPSAVETPALKAMRVPKPWSFDHPPIPEIDNSSITATLLDLFSFDKLT